MQHWCISQPLVLSKTLLKDPAYNCNRKNSNHFYFHTYFIHIYTIEPTFGCYQLDLSEQLGRHKKTATAFYDLMFNNNNPREAIEKYLGDGYIQHNPQSETVKKLSFSTLREWQQNFAASMSTSSG
jgi:hypothetical protein